MSQASLELIDQGLTTSALDSITEQTFYTLGNDFFRGLVQSLTKELGVKYAFISQLKQSSPCQLQTIAISKNVHLLENFIYDTRNTPCDVVIQKGPVFIPQDVQLRFPLDTWIRENNIKGYCAIPLYNSRRKPIGHIGISHDQPLSQNLQYELILKIFSARVSTEIERLSSSKALMNQKIFANRIHEYLDTVLTNMPVGVAILEGPEFRYFRINSTLANLNGLSIEDHIGKPLAEVLPRAAKAILPRLHEVQKTGEPSSQFEFSMKLPKDSNNTVHLIDSFFPIKEADGKVKAVCTVVIDITQRKNAELSLKEAHSSLEQRVKNRTLALSNEITNRMKIELDLETKNIALKEVLTQIELDKQKMKDDIMANIETLVLPSLDKFRLKGASVKHIDQLRISLNNLTSSFGRKISNKKVKLTPREIEVCNMVKNGITNKEIAQLLNIALHTVEKHRRTARRKHGLTNKNINLQSYLSSL